MKRLRLVNVTVVMTNARGANESPCGRYGVDFSRSVRVVGHVKRFLRLLIGARWNLREHFRNARDCGMIRSGGCRLGPPLSVGTAALLHLALGGQLGAVLNQPASPATREFDVLAQRLLEHNLERRLRSSTVLEQA